jgi:DNA-binding LacI/PurR family transcriptional regulator
LKDVAEVAGVSTVTASVVLNGAKSSNVGVSPATRQRVLEAATRLSYRPNAVARSLRRRSTNVVGFYSGSVYAAARGGAFLSQVIAGLQDGCEEHGKDLLVHGTFRGQSVDDIYAELASGKIDALVLHAPDDDALVSRLVRAPLPCVVIASPVEALPAVVVDDAEGMRLIARHLSEKGHRHVVFRHSRLGHTSARRRADAFQAEADSLGMRVTVTTPPYPDLNFTPEEEALLAPSAPDRATAVACWNDSSAYAALNECARRGLRVPENVAVTGFDGYAYPGVPRWRLTTVHAPWREAARAAVRLVVAHVRGEQISGETRLPVTLQAGDTV